MDDTKPQLSNASIVINKNQASTSSFPEFSRVEASSMLETLSLASIFREDYVIVMRPDFDVTLYGEPYIALMLFYNMKSGQYMARLWNKTLDSGEVMTLEHLADVCERHFSQRPLCLGCPEPLEPPLPPPLS